jgi:hypothetical protein
MVKIRQIAFSVVLLGFILNMSLFALASAGIPEVLGLDASVDMQATNDINDQATNVDLSTNSFESFLANIQILQIFVGIWDFIFIWPKVLASIPGVPLWIETFLGWPLSFLWICSVAFLITGRDI